MPTKEAKLFLEEHLAHPPQGTSLGHHFIQAYNENKWEWFLRYVRCLVPEHTPPPLIFGGAIHAAIEYAYRRWDPDGMVWVFREIMRSRREEYADPQQYQEDEARGPKLLLYWANQWLEHDHTTYDILGVELPLEVEVGHNTSLYMTMRLDLVVRDRTDGAVYIHDHKTTGWSISGTVSSMDVQDQVTAYLVGLRAAHPDWYHDCLGLTPDIIYQRGSVIKAERPVTLTRTETDLNRFELEMQGLIVEMAQKVQAYLMGTHHPYQLFPRNGKDAAMFGRVSYPDLQRLPLPNDPTVAPPGYRIDEETQQNVLRPFLETSDHILGHDAPKE